MGGGGAEVPYPKALRIAEEVMHALERATLRREIVGSIRRAKDPVGDIELLLQPRPLDGQASLFTTNLHDVRYDTKGPVEALIELDVLRKYLPLRFGPKYQKMIHVPSGVQVDLFWVLPPARWAPQQLIRTGPKGFSRAWATALKATGLRLKNGRVVDTRLKCPECKRDDPKIDDPPHDCRREIETKSELDCFNIVGWRYAPAKLRIDPPGGDRP